MFDWLIDLFDSCLSFIGDLLSSIMDFIKEHWLELLIIAIIVMAIWFPGTLLLIGSALSSGFAAVGSFIATLSATQVLALAVGLAFLIDPDSVTEAFTDVVEAVGDAVGTVASSVTDSIFSSSFAIIAGLGIAGYFLFVKSSDDDAYYKEGTANATGLESNSSEYSETETIDGKVSLLDY